MYVLVIVNELLIYVISVLWYLHEFHVMLRKTYISVFHILEINVQQSKHVMSEPHLFNTHPTSPKVDCYYNQIVEEDEAGLLQVTCTLTYQACKNRMFLDSRKTSVSTWFY